MVRMTPIRTAALQVEGLVGMLGSQLGEERATGHLFRGNPIHQGEVFQRGTLTILRSIPHGAPELVAGPEIEFLNNSGTDVDVVIAWSVCRFPASDEP
jgi:hypothetical protein